MDYYVVWEMIWYRLCVRLEKDGEIKEDFLEEVGFGLIVEE